VQTTSATGDAPRNIGSLKSAFCRFAILRPGAVEAGFGQAPWECKPDRNRRYELCKSSISIFHLVGERVSD